VFTASRGFGGDRSADGVLTLRMTVHASPFWGGCRHPSLKYIKTYSHLAQSFWRACGSRLITVAKRCQSDWQTTNKLMRFVQSWSFKVLSLSLLQSVTGLPGEWRPDSNAGKSKSVLGPIAVAFGFVLAFGAYVLLKSNRQKAPHWRDKLW